MPTVLYMIPRTSVLGAILVTGYLGGATASPVRLQDPWFLFPVVIGVLVWGGLYFRDERLRARIPLRSAPEIQRLLKTAVMFWKNDT